MRWLFAIVLLLLSSLTILVSCVTQPLVNAIESAPVTVDAVALEHHVRALSVTFHPRSHEHFDNLQRAGDYILDQFRAAGAVTWVQPVAAAGKVYRNILARFGPADGPRLVIGAHYDAAGDTPGADDNASGVAALIELARLLAATPPTRTVELVAYTLEEPPYFRTGHMGSMHHAHGLEDPRSVELMLSVEMIGFFTDAPDSQRYPLSALGLFYPDAGDFIAVVGRFGDFRASRRVKALFKGASDLPVSSLNAPASVPGVDFSDHASYWSLRIPALMITDTAFLRNPNYHRDGDTAETLDYHRMAKVVRALYAVAMEF